MLDRQTQVKRAMSEKPFENIGRETVERFAGGFLKLYERLVNPPVVRPFEQVSDLDEAVRKNAEYLKRLRDA